MNHIYRISLVVLKRPGFQSQKYGLPTQASKPSLDLFPRKCAYAKVIDLRNMVL